jgi:hypothetical protein
MFFSLAPERLHGCFSYFVFKSHSDKNARSSSHNSGPTDRHQITNGDFIEHGLNGVDPISLISGDTLLNKTAGVGSSGKITVPRGPNAKY